MILLFGIISPSFFSWNNFMAIFRNSSAVGIIALGMTFVIIAGGIDLSVGSNFTVCGVLLVTLQGSLGLPLGICIFITCLCGMTIGLINGLIISKAKLPPFIVTLAMQVFLRSIVKYMTNGATVRGLREEVFSSIGNGNLIGNFPLPFAIFIVIAILMHLLLTKTKFGTYVYATGGNEATAKYTGIKVDIIKISTYVLIGLMAAFASTIEVSRMASVSPTVSGISYELEAVTSAIVGGTAFSGGKGKIAGTIIGAIILFIITNIMIHLDVSTYLSGAVKGVIILVAVLLQKHGD
jgi:ribose transport system permease protein